MATRQECTCGPDYYDQFCPLHGTKSPDEKWKHLENNPDVPQTPREGEMPK